MAKFCLLIAVSLLATLIPSLQSPTGPQVHLTSTKSVVERGEQAVLSCKVDNLVPNAPFRVTFLREGTYQLYWYTVSHEQGKWTTTSTKAGDYLDLNAEPLASEWPVYNLGVSALSYVKHNYTCELYAEPHGKEGSFTSNQVEITTKAHK